MASIGEGRTVVFEDAITEYKGRALKSEVNAYFDPETNEYHVALDSVGQAYMYIALHETVHDIAQNNKEGYARVRQVILDTLSEKGQNIDELLEAQKALYLDQDADYWTEEVIANTLPVILTDDQTRAEIAQRIAGESEPVRNAFLRLLDKIKELLQKAYDILKQQKSWQQMKAIEGDIMAIAQIREAIATRWMRYRSRRAAGGQGVDQRHHGKKYVEFDRKGVITGSDTKAWAKQLEAYINEQVRRGKDVTVYAEYGTPLTITMVTAQKLGDRRLESLITASWILR